MVVVAWAAVLALILRHAVFVTHDSISNYAHVWYVSTRIWRDHELPWSMPVIGHGKAFAFPYGFLPWFSAALLEPVLGDWIVTLWLVAGTLALIAATFWAFPELRHGWWAAAVLVNPALVVAPIVGQLPFIWAMSMLLGAVACWRRRYQRTATVLAGLGQATHPAVVLPIGLLLVAGWWRWEAERRKLLRCYAVALTCSIPAVWLVFASPVMADSSRVVIITNFVGTLAVRSLVLVVPIALVALRRFRPRMTARVAQSLAPTIFGALLASNVALVGPLDARYAWGALQRRPDTTVLSFVDSAKFVPGATYRILRAQDGQIGMYQLVRHGARLDSEFFPESIVRNDFPSVTAYSQFLRKRLVDYVIIFDSYDRVWRTNEHGLLRRLWEHPEPGCGSGLVGARRTLKAKAFEVYRIRRCRTGASTLTY